jgi:hypothetical protein
MTRVLLSLFLLFGVVTSSSAQYPGFEKVLFPIVVYAPQTLPGAAGSQWVTDVSAVNRNDVEVPLADAFACFGCRTQHGMFPGITYELLPAARLPGAGAFVFVDSRYVDKVSFDLRVRDVSRGAESFGSEVPVVREREFREEGVSLLGVPSASNLRLTLRVYGLDPAPGSVKVLVYEERTREIINIDSQPAADTLFAQRTYSLNFDTVAGSHVDPAYAQISDLPMPATPLARIDVIPQTVGTRIWAFVSATNNDTQQVTVISPH